VKRVLRTIRTYILIGGVLVTPVAVTLWVILLLVNLLSNAKFTRWLTTPIFTHLPGENFTLVQATVSLIMVLGLLFLTGLVFRNFVGRHAYGLMDKLMERTPGINKIYLFVRTVSESILAKKETMFRDVVLIEYPAPGSYSVAFVSATVPPEFPTGTEEENEPHVFVFLPTTPNPTSGFLLLVPVAKTRKLNMTTSEAMRLIVSAGASPPGADLSDHSRVPTLLEKLDQIVLSQRPPSKPKPEPQANLNFPETNDEE